MFRTAVLFVTVVGGSGVACDVGSVLAQEGGGDGGSGGSGGTGSDCPAPTATPPTGHHAYNGAPGDTGETVTPVTAAQLALGCMGAGGCHNGSAVVGGIPTPDNVWDYGGVAYKDLAGTIPYAGATILLGTEPTSGTPTYVQMVVGANGFFNHVAGIDGFPDPATSTFINSWICDGTTKTMMSQSLGTMSTQNTTEMTNDGNCNGGTACHGVAGSTGGEFIYLTPS